MPEPTPFPPPGSRDVTSEYKAVGGVPHVPINSVLDGVEVMNGAENNNYLGRLTESEAKQVVNKHFSLDRWSEQLIFLIVNDQRKFDYENSFSAFVRHAVTLLLDYYRQKQLFGGGQGAANDSLEQMLEGRLDAERARLRSEFTRDVRSFDDELGHARKIGDFEHIARRLRYFERMIANCSSEAQKEVIRSALAQSVEIRSAVIAFYKWVTSEYRHDIGVWKDEWDPLARSWYEWFGDN